MLYGGYYFRYRKCHRATYASQYERAFDRARSQAEKIRAKFGRPGFEYEYCFPEKPKWMRWHTYASLKEKHYRLLEIYEEGWTEFAAALCGLLMRRADALSPQSEQEGSCPSRASRSPKMSDTVNTSRLATARQYCDNAREI